MNKLNKNKMQQMNNNIYKSNKIIEQKDELIKQLRKKKRNSEFANKYKYE